MPRIELEKKVPIGRGIFEIKRFEYELPEKIMFDDVLMIYNNRSGFYENMGRTISVSVRDYLRTVLREKGLIEESYLPEA